MLTIQSNVSLKTYNTFGIDAVAQYFTEIDTVEDLIELLKDTRFKSLKKLFLGGGSNILFLDDFDGIAIKINLTGIKIAQEDTDNVVISVGAGVVWQDFVSYCVANNYGGVENLSLIPGTVGAAPMQNIGAYGVEIKDVFESLKALNIEKHTIETFDLKDCDFAYRESIFKHTAKNKYVITEVSFRLNKKPEFHINYGAIKDTLAEMGIKSLNIKAISDAVIKIRQSKLPDPRMIGNAGSFFKNPEIALSEFAALQVNYPAIPSYPTSPSAVKVPAGWLIEQAGWKGKRFGDVGVHDKQALVLVNYGQGKGTEIKELSEKIQDSVKDKFGINLSTEVNFI